LRGGTAERADKANPDHKVGTQDRLQRSQFALNAASFGDMKARLDGTRCARRQTAAAKSKAAARDTRRPASVIKMDRDERATALRPT
jgi:hypothetical protein